MRYASSGQDKNCFGNVDTSYVVKKSIFYIHSGSFPPKELCMDHNNEVRYSADSRVNSVLYAVFAWMAVALGISASIAYYIGNSPEVYAYVMGNTWVVIAFFIAQFALVIGIMAFRDRMSAMTAMILFILYAITMGVTLSTIFLVYTTASIAVTFLVASGMFGGMALYGYFTKSDLSSVGSIGIMMLIGLIIGGLVNLFLKSPMVNMILSFVGVIVFSLLTAYDIQKIKNMSRALLADQETVSKVAIICALTLYLDFVNLFLYLLQIFGKKKEQ